jgi:MtrB/PioB family decaheme-associated outer membrane protein
MSTPRSHAIPTALASLGGLVASLDTTAVGAQEQEIPRPDTSTWKCEACPFARGHVADYELGGAHVSDDAAPFGNWTGYDEKGGYVVADGMGEYASDAHRMEWELEDLGLDSRSVSIEGGVPGTYEYRLGYSELPYRRYDTTQTPFQRASDQLLVLPAGWAPAGTTAGFTALDASLADQDIESDRQSIGIGGEHRGFEHLRLEADYRRTERDGWGIAGGPFYLSSALLAAPFDDRTDTASVAATYGREQWSAALSWSGSFYDNSNRELRWENPYLGGGEGARAQTPDNDAQTLAFNGQYRFSAAQTVLSLSAALGEMTQDDVLLSYTVNPAVPLRPLPRQSLDAKVDTTHFDVGFTSRPWSFLRLRGLYRYDDRDNRTPLEQWTRTITDLFDSGEGESNRPYSFRRNTLELSAAARLTQYDWLAAFEFEAGYDRVDTDRNLQEVAQGTEETGWGRVRWRPAAATEVTVRAGIARRDPDNYDLDVAAAYEQNPLMRKYTIGYRFRDFAQLNARVGWPDQPISIGAEMFYASDDYTESPLGLRKRDDRRFALDFTWAITDHTSFYAQGGYEDQVLGMLNSETFGAADWDAEQQDRFRTFDVGVRFSNPDDLFDTAFSLRYAKGASDVDVASSFSGAGAYPQLTTELKGAEFDVAYRLNDAIDLRLRVQYEDYSSSDWALQGVDPATIPTVLTLGADPYDYDVYLVSLSIRYSFGRGSPAPAAETETAQ